MHIYIYMNIFTYIYIYVLYMYMYICIIWQVWHFTSTGAIVCRLALGVGAGNSTATHARQVGQLLPSDVFKKYLVCNCSHNAFIGHNSSHGVHVCDILVDSEFFLLLQPATWLSPMDSNEMALHNAARKSGLTFDCKISYLEIPVCTSYDDDGRPIVELKGWPFLLPSDMEPWIYPAIFLDFVWRIDSFTCGFQ